jgi:hypothetical protein
VPLQVRNFVDPGFGKPEIHAFFDFRNSKQIRHSVSSIVRVGLFFIGRYANRLISLNKEGLRKIPEEKNRLVRRQRTANKKATTNKCSGL